MRIVGDDITISQAYINKHFYENNELWYEVRTTKSVYIFPASNVHGISANDDQNNNKTRRSYNHDYRYEQYTHQGDVSVTSTQQDEPQYQNNRQWRTKLMPNQFRFKLQPYPITIQAPKMMREAANWNIEWKDPAVDPKDMYENLRSKIEFYMI